MFLFCEKPNKKRKTIQTTITSLTLRTSRGLHSVTRQFLPHKKLIDTTLSRPTQIPIPISIQNRLFSSDCRCWGGNTLFMACWTFGRRYWIRLATMRSWNFDRYWTDAEYRIVASLTNTSITFRYLLLGLTTATKEKLMIACVRSHSSLLYRQFKP